MTTKTDRNADAIQIIEALGDTTKVARIFGIRKASVSDWKKGGIPRARMMYLKVKHAKAIRSFDTEAATAPTIHSAAQV